VSEPWLEVVIASKERETDDIVRLELRDAAGKPLPPFTAGAHIDLEVAPELVRQYSLCNSPGERHRYVLGILRENQSRGGSRAVHDRLQSGQTIRIRGPRNHFALEPDAGRYILFAGGIGVTPLLAMAEDLAAAGKHFELHYCTRSQARAAFAERLNAAAFSSHVHFHYDDGPGDQRLNIDRVLAERDESTHIYVCGPAPFIEFVLNQARTRGWNDTTLHREFFAPAAAPVVPGGEFEIQLKSTGQVFIVPADRTIVQVLEEAGITVAVSCEQGVCGTCLTRVLEGVPEHRDEFLTDAEHRSNDQMTLCCSRARSRRLLLDR
jgi:vanillate O-demethylase ferredoxin subunit